MRHQDNTHPTTNEISYTPISSSIPYWFDGPPTGRLSNRTDRSIVGDSKECSTDCMEERPRTSSSSLHPTNVKERFLERSDHRRPRTQTSHVHKSRDHRTEQRPRTGWDASLTVLATPQFSPSNHSTDGPVCRWQPWMVYPGEGLRMRGRGGMRFTSKQLIEPRLLLFFSVDSLRILHKHVFSSADSILLRSVSFVSGFVDVVLWIRERYSMGSAKR
jgi:hypothetical protein